MNSARDFPLSWNSHRSVLRSRPARSVIVLCLLVLFLIYVPLRHRDGDPWQLPHYASRPESPPSLDLNHESHHEDGGVVGQGSAAQSSKSEDHGLKLGDTSTGTDGDVNAHVPNGGIVIATTSQSSALALQTKAIKDERPAHQDHSAVPTNLDQSTARHSSPTLDHGYAYVFYATGDEYACSVLVNVDRLLHKFHTKYPIYVLVTASLDAAYIKAFEQRNVTVSVQEIPPLAEGSAEYYESCLVKLLAFSMHLIEPKLKRVLMLDSDQLIMKGLDHLFDGLPHGNVAAPRAYWIGSGVLSSTFMMIDLSAHAWGLVNQAIKTIKADTYDMDVLNQLFSDTFTVLPGSYVTINSHWEAWDLPKFYQPMHDQHTLAPQGLASLEPPKSDPLSRKAKRDEIIYKPRAYPSSTTAPQHEDKATPGPTPHVAPAADPAPAPPQGQPALSPDKTPKHDGTKPEDGVTAPQPPPPPPPPPTPPKPRKELRPFYKELFALQEQAEVLHFYALGKPWRYRLEDVRRERPDAHPVFYDQFKEWRVGAVKSCPGGEQFAD